MSLRKRGNVWWFEFCVHGMRVQESARTNSKTLARQAEFKRRRELEQQVNHIPKREKPRTFANAAEQWFAGKKNLTPLGRRYYRQYIDKLSRRFANRLLTDISLDDVIAIQHDHVTRGLSGRQANAEVGTLRAILTHYGLWAAFARRFKMLRQRSDVGVALAREAEQRLLNAIGRSGSPALYPFFILSLDAGLRPAETRALRRRNLNLTWQDGVIAEGEVIVGESKTEAGAGRAVPLTRRACAALSLWLSRFSDAGPDSYVFPFHRVAIAGYQRRPWIYAINLNRPMSPSSYRRSFTTAKRQAEIKCRFYDARHTFVTRLAENPVVSEETIRQLAGHVSPKMLSRYAHIRSQARRAAIATLEPIISEGDSLQFPLQSPIEGKPVLN